MDAFSRSIKKHAGNDFSTSLKVIKSETSVVIEVSLFYFQILQINFFFY
jgi:hypothetical protein